LTRGEYEQAYLSLGLQPIFIQVSTAGELESAVANISRRGSQALIVRGDNLLWSGRVAIMQAALRYKLPTFVDGQDFLVAGGLLSYSTGGSGDHFRFLVMIDKILRGANPADLPVEQPTKFELGVNLKAAKALGITIPQSLLLRADEVIR
jgi:putative ABC transport system substrate-binding protein